MLRPRANEIPDLVRRLGSRRRSSVDGARARLSIIGARAVEDLISALEGDDVRVRARAMPLLALIQDPRGREPVMAMLLDHNPRLRAIAAQCLARFPSPKTVAALVRVLEKERSRAVKVAAVRALVELYAAGQDKALAPLLELLAAGNGLVAVRLACLSLLPQIPCSERSGILRKLKEDEQEEVRQRAREFEAELDQQAELRPAADCQEILAALASDDYSVWNRAVQLLAARGASAIRPLLDEMQRRAHDPEFCTRAGMALKAMGPRRAHKVASALDEIVDPLPLQVLVDVIGALGEKSLIYRLKDLIERLAARPRSPGETNGMDLMQRVLAKAHLELARIGSRVAIQNLREILADPEHRVEIELLAAVERIGKREEIGVLLRAYQREDSFIKGRIADGVRTIMKREHIRRNNPFFQTLSPSQRRALASILPPLPPRPRKRLQRPGIPAP